MSYQWKSTRASLDLRNQHQQLASVKGSDPSSLAYQQQQQQQQHSQKMPLSLPSSLAQRNSIPYPIDAITSDPTVQAHLSAYDQDRQYSVGDAAANSNMIHASSSNNIPSPQAHNINNEATNMGSLTDTSILPIARTSLQTHQKLYNSNQTDPRSPLVILIPTSAQPTEILAARFSAWRSVIRAIVVLSLIHI